MPMTRVEGRGRFEITIAENGTKTANLLIEDYRGFERFLRGKMAADIPRIVPKVCGMCSISHALASCKAIENCLGISITQTAQSLRRLMLLCEIAKSHIVHACYMMLPDIREISVQTRKRLSTNALEIIRICDSITSIFAGKSIHPLNCIIGGMSKHLDHTDRHILRKRARKILQIAQRMEEEISIIEGEEEGKIIEPKAVYMGLQKAGEVNFYDGDLRVVNNDESKDVVFSVEDYEGFLETNPNGNFVFKDNRRLLVGPVARSHIGSYPSGNKFQAEAKDFAAAATQARLNEVVECLTEAYQLLGMAKLCSSDIRVPVETPNGRGIGAVEAPRGTLIHDFEFEKGYVEKARLLVATSFNLDFMQVQINNILRRPHNEHSRSSAEGYAKRAIRSFDPCISCLGA